MYKVENPNPDIIARTTDTPTGEFMLTPKGPISVAFDHFKSIQPFLTNPHIDPLKKLAKLFKFIDWFVKFSGATDKAVCQKGCAHCCFIDVDVTLLEAVYIAKNTGLTAVKRNARIRAGYHKHRHYCPFLDQNTASCTIYQYRPLSCRTFYVFDNPKFCADGTDHGIYCAKSNDLILFILGEIGHMGNGCYADIREWFKEYTTDAYDSEYRNEFSYTG